MNHFRKGRHLSTCYTTRVLPLHHPFFCAIPKKSISAEKLFLWEKPHVRCSLTELASLLLSSAFLFLSSVLDSSCLRTVFLSSPPLSFAPFLSLLFSLLHVKKQILKVPNLLKSLSPIIKQTHHGHPWITKRFSRFKKNRVLGKIARLEWGCKCDDRPFLGGKQGGGQFLSWHSHSNSDLP